MDNELIWEGEHYLYVGDDDRRTIENEMIAIADTITDPIDPAPNGFWNGRFMGGQVNIKMTLDYAARLHAFARDCAKRYGINDLSPIAVRHGLAGLVQKPAIEWDERKDIMHAASCAYHVLSLLDKAVHRRVSSRNQYWLDQGKYPQALPDQPEHCTRCGEPIDPSRNRGRPKFFCSTRCRVAAHRNAS